METHPQNCTKMLLNFRRNQVSPKVECFFEMIKIQGILCIITQLIKEWSLCQMIDRERERKRERERERGREKERDRDRVRER